MAEIIVENAGSITLLENFGSDLTVVNAARVSVDKRSAKMCAADAKLIRYLAEHDHISPFFHPQIRFRIKMPIFLAREWYRHTIGFARNEVSRRYVDSPPEFWMPSVFRERSPKLKQGSKETEVENATELRAEYEKIVGLSADFYAKMLRDNVAPEIARTILPQGMYTEFIETASLAAYARLCKLRTGSDAQKEVRAYAQTISDILGELYPVSWAALRTAPCAQALRTAPCAQAAQTRPTVNDTLDSGDVDLSGCVQSGQVD